jgi:hypothetical protein
MIRRVVLIDAVLVIILAAGIIRFRDAWGAFWLTHRVDTIQASAETVTGQAPVGIPTAAAASDWTEIAGRNPFSFDRTDAPILAAAPAEVAGPKPILFGTMSLGPEVMAMMATGQPGNRNAKPMRLGEALDGWVLVEIQDKSVVVKNGDRRENVIMNDPTAQVPRDVGRTASAPAAPPPAQVNPTPAPAANAPGNSAAAPVAPPTPVDANGQPKKGHFVFSPFGTVFVEDR